MNNHLLLIFLATIMQVYYYALFNHATSFLAHEFMPSTMVTSPVIGIFAILGATAFLRPLGSVIYGTIADLYSRSLAIKIAILSSILSIILVGIIPSYNSIGISASILFLLCRVAFMVSWVGETDGVRIYILEVVSAKYKNLANSIIASCYQIGAQLALLSLWLVSSLGVQHGWRLCFIIGGIVDLLFIARWRMNIIPENNNKSKISIRSVLLKYYQVMASYRRLLIPSVVIQGSISAIYCLHIYFLPIYLTKILKIADYTSLGSIVLLGLLLYAIIAPLGGYLADKYSFYHRIAIISILFNLVFITINILQIHYNNNFIAIFYVIPIMTMPLYSSFLQVKIGALFIPAARMRLFSISHSVGSVLISSNISYVTALICTKFSICALIIVFITLYVIMLYGILVIDTLSDYT